MSHTQEKKKSMLCLQKVTLLSSFLKLQLGSLCERQAEFVLTSLSCMRERCNNGCLVLFLSSLQTVMFAFSYLCCQEINSTSRRNNGHQKEETMGTDMAETISVTSVHTCSSLASFSSKNSTEKHGVCAS